MSRAKVAQGPAAAPVPAQRGPVPRPDYAAQEAALTPMVVRVRKMLERRDLMNKEQDIPEIMNAIDAIVDVAHELAKPKMAGGL